MVEQIEELISILEAQSEEYKRLYHKLLSDRDTWYLIDRAKARFEASKKQVKITKQWYGKLKSLHTPKEVNYLDNGKVQYIYRSKMN